MQTHGIEITLVIAGIVIFAMARQVMPQRIKLLSFVILPLIAAYESYHSLPRTIPVDQIIECLVSIVAALAVGAIQAAFTRVYYKDNQLYMRGGMVSLFAWIGLMFFRFIVGFIFQGTSMFTSFHSFEWLLWAAVAVAFGSRSFILFMKHPEIKRVLAAERASKHA